MSQDKPKIIGTFEIRINSNADKSYLYNYIHKYKHWQNIITIMVTAVSYTHLTLPTKA